VAIWRIRFALARRRSTKATRRAHHAAAAAALELGNVVLTSRTRRRWSQDELADRVGMHRTRIGQIERGHGGTVPLERWFAIAEALERPLRISLGRDELEAPPDAGHLLLQELVLRLARGAGYTGRFELATRSAEPSRSADAGLRDDRNRRLVLVECVNTFGDIGASVRSSDRKRAEAANHAIAISPTERAYSVHTCWVVRATRANRALVARYPHIFASRFPGSSARWVAALTTGATPPDEPGLVWADVAGTRLFAWRRPKRT
jgi:transcriptional regulator with XRE-family HTH domain